MNSDGSYFFLSYAHSAPVTDGEPIDPDHWVRVFFDDLQAEVNRRAGRPAGTRLGFVDYQIAPGADWKAQLAGGLAVADVFVPLYSPNYVNRSWSLSERQAFEIRLSELSRERRGAHVQPVLWMPLAPWDEPPVDLDEALALGAEAPKYADNGLRALCMLRPFKDQYKAVLKRLAKNIVWVAQNDPLARSRVPTKIVAVAPKSRPTPFVVAVLAPAGGGLPPGRGEGAVYGPRSEEWRPFGNAQALPIADYAANVAERFNLPTIKAALPPSGAMPDEGPGLILVDPWILAGADGHASVSAAIAGLRSWITLVVVADHNDPQYAERGSALTKELLAMVSPDDAGRVPTALNMEEFDTLMPDLVARMRRHFLRHGSVFPPKGPHTPRPRRSDNSYDPQPGERDR